MLPLFAYSVDLNDLLLLAQQVDRTERRMLQLQKPIIYFGIALGHPQVTVPHLLLQCEQVSAILEIQRGKTMPQLIRCDFDAAQAADLSKVFVQIGCSQAAALVIGKQPILPLLRLHVDESSNSLCGLRA